MRIEENGQGFLRKNLEGKLAYYSFMPTPLKDVKLNNLSSETMRLLGACSRKLGELEGILRFLPNASMYLAMYVRKEALLSAQIEGTQCTFDDIFDPGNEHLASRDVADVVACIQASEYAVKRMKELPLCTRLFCEIHKMLLAGTRGQEKEPGFIRTTQNWIGPAGCSLREATFVPPNVDDLKEVLSEIEHYAHEEQMVDPVIKAAMIHYQFETAHPFLDGNGRMGRLLITLSLLNDGALSSAVFYPSYQLKLNRREYYERLTNVRECGCYDEWVEFFCRCILASAEDALKSLTSLVELRERCIRQINQELGKSASNGLRLLDLIEGNPIVEINFVASRLEVSRTTAVNLVNAFVQFGILTQKETQRQRYRTFLYEDYLEILRQGGDPFCD